MTLLPGQFHTPRPLHVAWGERFTIKVPAPVAGTDFAYALLPGWAYEIVAVQFALTVAAGKAEAEPGLLFKGGQGNARGAGVCTIKTKELVTTKYMYQRELPSTGIASGGLALGWLPQITLGAASEVVSLTKGIEAGDTITNIELVVERYPTDYDHDDAELKGMAERLDRLERKLIRDAAAT